MKEMSNLICGKAAVGGNYNSTRDNLECNPVKKAMSMKGGKPPVFQYWTREEYEQFIAVCESNTNLYFAFSFLYWCGMREGELLALRKKDFNFVECTVLINKTLATIEGEVIINRPKAHNGIRTITIPPIFCREF